jgi:LuxR family maltose regulon positive regulatory protein
MRIALAVLRLTRGDPQAATAALAPVLDGSNPVAQPVWLVEALLLEAITRAALSDQDAASSALERALDLTEPDRAVLPFLFHPAPELLERHATQHTEHPALIAEILSRLAGKTPASPPEAPAARAQPLLAPVSKSELRVLRYLPTRLSAQEIAGELGVSSNTVKTHMRTLYAKLGAHSRAEAIDRARALGLLASSARRVLPRASGVRRAVRRQRAGSSPAGASGRA